MELNGNVSEPMAPRVWYRSVGNAMDRYLGPSVGMSVTERWHSLRVPMLLILCEAVEERAAIVHWS
jgi:hypothetical protein